VLSVKEIARLCVMDDREQEAIIQGVQYIVMAHADNPQNVFDYFRNDTEFRSHVAAFINRGKLTFVIV
jgi:hypothetical protein